MKGAMTVRYRSGREEKFEVEFWSGTVSSAAQGRLHEFLKEPDLVLQTSTELIIIPTSSIESISIALPKAEAARPELSNVRFAKRVS